MDKFWPVKVDRGLISRLQGTLEEQSNAVPMSPGFTAKNCEIESHNQIEANACHFMHR